MRPPADYQFEIFKKFSNQDAYPLANRWLAFITGLPGIMQGEITGELRRGSPSVNKIEIIIASEKPESSRKAICDLLTSKGYDYEKRNNHVDIQLENGLELTIWVAGEKNFGSLLHNTTGSQSHLNWFSLKAAQRGLDYQEGELQQNENPISFSQEIDLFEYVKMPYIPPEIREGWLENEFFKSPQTNRLVASENLKADLHVHSDWSDGSDTMEMMAQAAIDNKLSLIAFTEHSPHLLSRRYTDHTYLFKQQVEIDKLNQKFSPQLKILKGVEVDILEDGSLDLSDDLLARMEVVIASMHTRFDLPKDVITTRFLKAINNPFVNIIGHPGGRLFPMSDYTDVDWDEIFKAAAFNQVALEINSHKSHPLFDGQRVHLAARQGVPIIINSDAHHTGMFKNNLYGAFIARRAGLGNSQVINTWPTEDIQAWLKDKNQSAQRGNI